MANLTFYLRALATRTGQTARHWRPALLAVLGALLALGAQAQATNFFADDAAARNAAGPSALAKALRASRPLTLDVTGLRGALATAPLESRTGAAPLLLTLPLPDGTNAHFTVREAPVMAPTLAAQFPDIKTYAGVGVDDPTASVRLDLTARGFHAQVLSSTTGDFYIDPIVPGTMPPTQYLSFWKRDMPGRQFECGTQAAGKAHSKAKSQTAQRSIAATLRTYRLALAATGEYTAFYGGTVPLALAAMVTTVNRVVGVYEKELDVRMILVANTSQLIYTDPNTDPYTNSDPNALLTQNQANVDLLIGNANYDIGHVFSTGGGGLAGLGVVCETGQKAQGETGSSAPVGDAFDIDFVAHEMGHEFGANHTFNGNGTNCADNRNPGTAYEPGSGTTIMGYAGVCNTANNVQNNSDAYFHVVSYEEIQDYLATTTCGVSSGTGNNAPSVAVLPASGKVLPISTPFKLTAGAYDSDADAITYCWEQYDLGAVGSPTSAQTANNNIPLFRSFTPTASPMRYFPRLADIIGNTVTKGERLPTVTRTLTFRVTVRDQHNGAQGVVGGVNSSQAVTMTTTSAAGPFLVTAPNTTLTWAGGSSQTVTWDVAGTTANNVNCALVNIRLSIDGGLTYPTLLLAATPNDGTEAITVPSINTATARVMVEAADNYFFDISNANFAISTATVCAAPTNVTVGNISATTATVSFTAGPNATSYVVTTTPATTSQTVSASPVTLTGLTAGTTYVVNVASTCAGSTSSNAVTATFSTTPPPACNEVIGVTFSNVTSTSATVSFTATTTATSYTITTSPATTTQTVTGTTATLTGLTVGTVYTVFVRSSCPGGGQATAMAVFAPRPLNDDCPNAISLPVNTACVTTAGTVSGATQTQAPATCSQALSTQAADVWYTFVANDATQTVTLASTFDGVVQLFSGTCGSLTSLGCADVAGPGGTETLTLTNLTAGTRYYVRVYTYTENSLPSYGTFTICVTGTAVLATAPALEAGQVSIAPNPAHSSFTLTLPALAGQRTVQATLLNVLGQAVVRRTIALTGASTSADFDTRALAPGVYMLRLQAGDQTLTQRVLVE